MMYFLVPKDEDLSEDAKAAFVLSGDLTHIAEEIGRDAAALAITGDRPGTVVDLFLSTAGVYSLSDGRCILTSH